MCDDGFVCGRIDEGTVIDSFKQNIVKCSVGVTVVGEELFHNVDLCVLLKMPVAEEILYLRCMRTESFPF